MSGHEMPLPVGRRARPSLTRWLDRLPEGRFALVVATPGLLLLGIFVLPPALAALGMSFFRIELLRDDLTPFVGVRNYLVRLPADADFLDTLPRTLGFAIVTSALAVPLALATALLIHGRARFGGLLAVVLLLPWAVAPIADGILWRLMFEPRDGVLTILTTQLGLPSVVIREAPGALTAMVVAVTWRAIPLLAVLFLGALRMVPADALRAARLDGASRYRAFRHITLPAIAPVVVAAGLLQVILALQVFEVQYALSEGAPPPGSRLTGHAIFDTVIRDISLGYGAALTVTLGLCIAVCLAALYLVIRPGRSRTSGADPKVVDDDATDRAVVHVRRADPSIGRDPRPVRAVADPRLTGRLGTRARSVRGPAGTVLAAVVALVLAVALAGPIAWIAIASTQPPATFDAVPPRLTLALDLSAYGRLLSDASWQGAAVVSATVSVLATLLALVVAVLAAYPLARFRLRGSGVLLTILLACMLIPPIALAIPVLFLVIGLGVRDTILGLVLLNAAFWSPILIWIVRGAFVGVPRELERAARIDGCSRIGAIFRIALPAAWPIIAAGTVIVFVGIWNDFVFTAVIGGRATQTLPRYLGESATPAFNEFATRIILTIAPCIALIALARNRIMSLR